jgi:hypothetical protein
VKRGVIKVTMEHVAQETASSSNKMSKSMLEQPDDKLAVDGSHNTPIAGPSVKKRVLPKMILDAPTDDDDFKPRTKRKRTQSNKQIDSCQIREKTVPAVDLGNQDCETTRVEDVIMID